jgi:hypothetical protein
VRLQVAHGHSFAPMGRGGSEACTSPGSGLPIFRAPMQSHGLLEPPLEIV